MRSTHPTILAVGGRDPSGGAGLRADVETIAALGGRALEAATCDTEQDSVNAYSCAAADAGALRARIEELAARHPIDAVKIGLTPTPAIVDAVAGALTMLARVPVVLDPVLAAGGGYVFCDDETTRTIARRLLPRAAVATPNLGEALRLAPGARDADAAAARILQQGCGALLITGAAADEERLHHRLYRAAHAPLTITCARLPHRYHGSGCTLASALALELARAAPLARAARRAHDYAYRCLARAPIPVRGNPHPERGRREANYQRRCGVRGVRGNLRPERRR